MRTATFFLESGLQPQDPSTLGGLVNQYDAVVKAISEKLEPVRQAVVRVTPTAKVSFIGVEVYSDKYTFSITYGGPGFGFRNTFSLPATVVDRGDVTAMEEVLRVQLPER